MRRVSDAVYRWFMADVSHKRMAIARILLGYCLFAAYAVRIPDIQFFYGPHGYAGYDYMEAVGRNFMYASGMGQWLIYPNSELFVNICYATLLVSAFCLMVGFRARFFGILAILLSIAFDQRNYFATAGWSKVIHSFILYVILSRAGEIWSVDAYLKRRKTGARETDTLMGPVWPMRLLQIHTCTMYFVSAWPRLSEGVWLKGYAVTFALQHYEYSRFNVNLMGWASELKTIDWMALIAEPFAFVGLWLPVIGPIWAVALLMMHLTLEVFTHVDWWTYVMLAGLICFIPEPWLRPQWPSFAAVKE